MLRVPDVADAEFPNFGASAGKTTEENATQSTTHPLTHC